MSQTRTHPLGYFETVSLTTRLTAAFDELVYRDVPVVRLLSVPIHQLLMYDRFVAPGWKRRLIDALPGRLFLRLRARLAREWARRWRGAGVVAQAGADRGVLDRGLALVETPWRPLSILHDRRPGAPRLAHFAPGNLRPGIAHRVAGLYRLALRGDPELARWFPADPDWLLVQVLQVMDALDAARIFWEASGSPGGVTSSHLAPEDLAFGLEGRRAGRKVMCLHHGYLIGILYWVNGCFDAFGVWDDHHARRVRAISGGTCLPLVTGHYGYLSQALPPLRARPQGKPQVLLASTVTWRGWERYYEQVFRELCARDVPWTVVRKPHPAELEMGITRAVFGPNYRLVEDRTIYALMAESDLLVHTISGTGAEARMVGLRSLCLAHPSEAPMLEESRHLGIDTLDPGESVQEAVRRVLAAPPRPALPAPPADTAPGRLASYLDLIFRGRLPATGPAGHLRGRRVQGSPATAPDGGR